jgi:hypothetical protein
VSSDCSAIRAPSTFFSALLPFLRYGILCQSSRCFAFYSPPSTVAYRALRRQEKEDPLDRSLSTMDGLCFGNSLLLLLGLHCFFALLRAERRPYKRAQNEVSTSIISPFQLSQPTVWLDPPRLHDGSQLQGNRCAYTIVAHATCTIHASSVRCFSLLCSQPGTQDVARKPLSRDAEPDPRLMRSFDGVVPTMPTNYRKTTPGNVRSMPREFRELAPVRGPPG